MTPGADETVRRPDAQVVFSGLFEGVHVFGGVMLVLGRCGPVFTRSEQVRGDDGEGCGRFSVAVQPEQWMGNMKEVVGIHGDVYRIEPVFQP